MTKSSMLPKDKLAIKMISLMRWGHGGAQRPELGLQALPIKKGFARVVVAVGAEDFVKEGTR